MGYLFVEAGMLGAILEMASWWNVPLREVARKRMWAQQKMSGCCAVALGK